MSWTLYVYELNSVLKALFFFVANEEPSSHFIIIIFFHQLQFRFLAVRQKAKHPFVVCWNSGQNALRSHIYEAIASRIRSSKLSVWKLICGINERRGVLLWSEWAAGKTVEEEDYPLRITGNWDLELNLRICLTFLCLTITWWLQGNKFKRSLFLDALASLKTMMDIQSLSEKRFQDFVTYCIREYYRVIQSVTECCRVLQSTTEYYRI